MKHLPRLVLVAALLCGALAACSSDSEDDSSDSGSQATTSTTAAGTSSGQEDDGSTTTTTEAGGSDIDVVAQMMTYDPNGVIDEATWSCITDEVESSDLVEIWNDTTELDSSGISPENAANLQLLQQYASDCGASVLIDASTNTITAG